MTFLAADPAQTISALTPFLLVILLPFARWAIQSALRSEINNTVRPELASINRRIDDHMRAEETDLRRIADERSRTHDRLTRIEARLAVIEERSHDRRREDR